MIQPKKKLNSKKPISNEIINQLRLNKNLEINPNKYNTGFIIKNNTTGVVLEYYPNSNKIKKMAMGKTQWLTNAKTILKELLV